MGHLTIDEFLARPHKHGGILTDYWEKTEESEYLGTTKPLTLKCLHCQEKIVKARGSSFQQFGCPCQRNLYNLEKFLQLEVDYGGIVSDWWEVCPETKYLKIQQPLTLKCRICGENTTKKTATQYKGYGCSCETNRKREDTMMREYGVRNILSHPETRKLTNQSLTKKGVCQREQSISPDYQEYLVPLSPTTLEDFCLKYKKLNGRLPTQTEAAAILGYSNHSGIARVVQQNRLQDLFSKNKEGAQDDLKLFIKNLLPSDTIILSNKRLKGGSQIDIYIPSLQIGFEYHGLVWHSSNNAVHGNPKDKNYHLTKMNAAEQEGIQLVQVFEDEWLFNRRIVESKIQAILKSKKTTIGARETEIKELSSSELKLFLEKNHIQGYIGGSWKKGLFHKRTKELLGVMSFRKAKENSFELSRYSTEVSISLAGGFSKLLKDFKREFPEAEIFSFADLRWTNKKSNIYEKNGFRLVSQSAPNYFYFLPREGIRKSRLQFQKHKLESLFPDQYNPEETEIQNMTRFGYWQIYDAGNLKFIL